MVCKLDPKCEIQCDDCKSFYQRMSEKRNVLNEDDIYDISLSDWVDYMVDWSAKTKEEEE
jgi:hypothetical protein